MWLLLLLLLLLLLWSRRHWCWRVTVAWS